MLELTRETTRIYALNEEGKLVAEITFPMTAPGIYRPGTDQGKRRTGGSHLLLCRLLVGETPPSLTNGPSLE